MIFGKEVWGRLDQLLDRFRVIANQKYGSDSNVNMSRVSGLSPEYVRKLENHDSFPGGKALKKMAEALGTVAIDLQVFLETGEQDLAPLELTDSQVVDYLFSQGEDKFKKIVGEVYSKYHAK